MSAWMVSRDHIAALVVAGVQLGVIRRDEADEVGKRLWNENAISVRYRYSHLGEEELLGMGAGASPLQFSLGDVPEVPVDLPVVAVSIDCLEYQSCEHPGWKASEARRYLDELREAVGGHPDRMEPWGIEDLAEALVSAAV